MSGWTEPSLKKIEVRVWVLVSLIVGFCCLVSELCGSFVIFAFRNFFGGRCSELGGRSDPPLLPNGVFFKEKKHTFVWRLERTELFANFLIIKSNNGEISKTKLKRFLAEIIRDLEILDPVVEPVSQILLVNLASKTTCSLLICLLEKNNLWSKI